MESDKTPTTPYNTFKNYLYHTTNKQIYQQIKIENNQITFWYQRHEDDKFIVEKIHKQYPKIND